MLPATFSAFELQPLPDGASTILRLLAAQAPNWPEIALVAARDPALSLALLVADPLRPGELQDGLNTLLRRRLERIGSDLLRAWLLGDGLFHAAGAGGAAHAGHVIGFLFQFDSSFGANTIPVWGIFDLPTV